MTKDEALSKLDDIIEIVDRSNGDDADNHRLFDELSECLADIKKDFPFKIVKDDRVPIGEIYIKNKDNFIKVN